MKIFFNDLTTKRDVLTKAKTLKDSTNKVAQGMFINPDLTEAQRKKDKELREKMWEIRRTENKNVIMQKGEIKEVSYFVPKTKRYPVRRRQENVEKEKAEKDQVQNTKDSNTPKEQAIVAENKEQLSNKVEQNNEKHELPSKTGSIEKIKDTEQDPAKDGEEIVNEKKEEETKKVDDTGDQADTGSA